MMQDLYQALGSIVAAAHANGHTVHQTRRPEQDATTGHLVDIDADAYLVRFRAETDEPRFGVATVYPFDAILRESYTPAIITERTGSEFEALGADERDRAIESVIHADLQRAQETRQAFERRCTDELPVAAPDVQALTYGEGDLWNGFIIRDHVFPYEGLSPEDYRDVVNRVERTTHRTRQIVDEVTDVLDPEADHDDELLRKQTRSPAFQ